MIKSKSYSPFRFAPWCFRDPLAGLRARPRRVRTRPAERGLGGRRLQGADARLRGGDLRLDELRSLGCGALRGLGSVRYLGTAVCLDCQGRSTIRIPKASGGKPRNAAGFGSKTPRLADLRPVTPVSQACISEKGPFRARDFGGEQRLAARVLGLDALGELRHAQRVGAVRSRRRDVVRLEKHRERVQYTF